jgi:hypothetical protein
MRLRASSSMSSMVGFGRLERSPIALTSLIFNIVVDAEELAGLIDITAAFRDDIPAALTHISRKISAFKFVSEGIWQV